MLEYYDDKKKRSQSHEVYDKEYDDIQHGYGYTKEEAFKDYKRNVNEYFDKLVKFKEELSIDNI